MLCIPLHSSFCPPSILHTCYSAQTEAWCVASFSSYRVGQAACSGTSTFVYASSFTRMSPFFRANESSSTPIFKEELDIKRKIRSIQRRTSFNEMEDFWVKINDSREVFHSRVVVSQHIVAISIPIRPRPTFLGINWVCRLPIVSATFHENVGWPSLTTEDVDRPFFGPTGT